MCRRVEKEAIHQGLKITACPELEELHMLSFKMAELEISSFQHVHFPVFIHSHQKSALSHVHSLSSMAPGGAHRRELRRKSTANGRAA